MVNRFLLCLLLLITAAPIFGASVVPLAKSYGGTTYPICYSLPSPMSSPKMIVFLHGLGERGNGSSDGTLTYASGTNEIAYEWKYGPFTCITNGVTWFHDNNIVVIGIQAPTSVTSFNDITLDNTIVAAMADFGVDSTHVCVTGLSMGGAATWVYGKNHPARIYSLVPIAGSTFTGSVPLTQFTFKTWAFHDRDDGTVPACWDYGTTSVFTAQIFTTAWLYQISGSCALDNHPDAPFYLTHTSYPQLNGTVLTRTGSFAAGAWTWSSPGFTLPTSNLGTTLYPSGGHEGWTATYGTDVASFNLTFWQWAMDLIPVPPPPVSTVRFPSRCVKVP